MATLGTFAAFSSKAFGGGGSGSLVLPTGGNYIIEDRGDGYRVHVFTSTGTFNVPSNIIPDSGYFTAQILVVGGGGSASSDYGGGGGGGAVIYASDFKIGKGMSFPVTVGGAGGTSSFYGLHPAPGGGNGAGGDDFSRGWPGGCGGGGSWQNARPAGGINTQQHPGWHFGTVGPAVPTYQNFQVGAPNLGPNYATYCSITREARDPLHAEGNHQYNSTAAAPSSAVGPVTTSPYGGNGFRSRGGGGVGWSGGFGGLGLATTFLSDNESSWSWIVGGGNGKPGDNYTGRGTSPNGQVWRDVGRIGTTLYPSGFVAAATSTDRLSSGQLNLPIADYAPVGSQSYGGGGGYIGSRDGTQGIIRIRYDLQSYPGGLAAAQANIFGGTITVSANGKYRYHTWTGAGERNGTGSNSQTWYISGDYQPRYFPSSSTDTVWPQRTNPTGSAANTDPFYFYGDIPSTSFQFMLIAGGGASGYPPTSDDASGDYYHWGGGGAGSLLTGSFGSDSKGPVSYTMGGLQNDLYVANTNGDGSSRQTTGSFDMRPGFIEVYANSLANPRMQPWMYEYSIARNVAKDSREQNGTIKIRGTNGSGATQQAFILRSVHEEELGEGVWGSLTNGSAGANSNRAYYFIMKNLNGNPSSVGWGDSIYLNDTYDHFYYNTFYKAIASPNNLFVSGIPTTGAANYVRGTTHGNWTSTLGSGTRSASQISQYWNANQATGVHPLTGESYYNAVQITQAIPRWADGTDKWDAFWTRVTGWGTTVISGTNYDAGASPAMVKGLNNIDNNYDRCISLSAALLGGTGDCRIQMVLENSTGSTSRRFEYHEGSGDICIPAGWKLISNNSNNAEGQPNGTTFARTGTVRPTVIRMFKWDLRRIVVRRLFAIDVQVGSGGAAGRVSPNRARSGAPTVLLKQTEDTPGTNRYAGGGGSGGHGGYTSQTAEGSAVGGQAVPAKNDGWSNDDRDVTEWTTSPTSSPWGGAGGGSWIQGDAPAQSTVHGSNAGAYYGSPSDGVEAYGSGATGGGATSTLALNGFEFMGAPRGGGTSNGKKMNTSARNTQSQNGGSGYFGGTVDWAYEVRTITCDSPAGTPRPQPGDSPYPEYWYYLNINQYPQNAQFSAGGGGGAGGNGSNGAGTAGGPGGSGYTSSITGIPIVYSHGGGGFGRRKNGTPGSSQPANPASQTYAPGAPIESPAYLPYGGGGGWSPGRQEGFGVNATGYWPGNAPWPVAYDVATNVEHMDAMRYWNSPIPAPQLGNLGSAYSGKQGVVIVAYFRGPLIYK